MNEAWTAAGMKGTIGDTLIYQRGAEMGLSGKLRAEAKPKTAAKAKSAAKMSKAASQSRQDHVRQGVFERPSSRQLRCREQGVATAGFEGRLARP